MGKAIAVHQLQAFGQLQGDLTSLGFGELGVDLEVALQVAMSQVFHGDKDAGVVLEPSRRPHKAMSVLQAR
jgi:hypothetical protein